MIFRTWPTPARLMGWVVVAAALAILPTATPTRADAQSHRYAGRPVADVLKELESTELRFIFSTDLVTPTMLVKSEPTATRPRDIARQILAEHRLALESGPRGRQIVVADRRPSPPPSSQPTGKADAGPPARTPAGSSAGLRIEEVVDVTDRLSDLVARAGVQKLEPVALREMAGGFENVFQALQLLPSAAGIDDDGGKLTVRGTGPEHNMVVVDGVQIHNPYRLGAFTASFLNPATAAGVHLDASGLDARHGGRLSSVTIIDTRDGVTDRALAVSGSLGLTSGDLLLEGRLPRTTSGSWWATTRGTYYRPLVNRFGDEAVPGFGDAQFKVTAHPTDRTRLTFFGLAGREMSFEPDGIADPGHVDGGEDGGGQLIEGSRYTGVNRLAVMNHWWTPGPKLATATTLSTYAHESRERDASLLVVGFAPFERELGVHDLAARHRLVFNPAGGHLLDAGVEVHRIQSTWQMSGMKLLEFPRGLGPSTFGEGVAYSGGPIDTRLVRTQVGAWGQHRLPLGSRVAVEPGVRFEWNSFTREALWQPRLRVSGSIRSSVLWVGFAEQAQTPSHEGLQGHDYFELTASDGGRLKSERSRQIVAGLERTFGGGFSLRVEAYRRRFDRLLVQRLETESERAVRLERYDIPADLPADSVILEYRPTIVAESTGRGSSTGVEIQVERSAGYVSGMFSYAYNRATREMHGRTFPFDFDRPHSAKATLFAQPWRRVRLSATWQLASGFPVTPLHEEVRFFKRIFADGSVDPIARPARRADGSLAMTLDPTMRRLTLRNAERLAGYGRTDVRVTYATLGHWEFYGEVLNVFNQRNFIEHVDIPPSVSGSNGSATENNVSSYFERLPSFGVRVKF